VLITHPKSWLTLKPSVSWIPCGNSLPRCTTRVSKPSFRKMVFASLTALLWLITVQSGNTLRAELTTWDGRHSIERIELTVVYFVPSDAQPLPDWRERVDYYCQRLQQFHHREFAGQAELKVVVRPEPFSSKLSTSQLRRGDANAIFFRTLREVDRELEFAQHQPDAFPILLVLSEINWRELDDFYRVKPGGNGQWVFDGNYHHGRHFPGAAAGGARATYLADAGRGWGLVSGDGWRVPYSGSDCVVYHEGVGHPIGLPHPEPLNASVMGTGQYAGWINESWLDEEQKLRLGYQRPEQPASREGDLFTSLTALPHPQVPQPGEPVKLQLSWPQDAQLKRLRVCIQTDLYGAWTEVAVEPATESADAPPADIALGSFDRPTPVSYRVEATLADGQHAQIWGYFQVRSAPDELLYPRRRLAELTSQGLVDQPAGWETKLGKPEIDLLELLDVGSDRVVGQWEKADGVLSVSKGYGHRLELPYAVPEEYELVIIAEPLDKPNGLILGQVIGGQRFLVLLNFLGGDAVARSALENVNGGNVGNNDTTIEGEVLVQNRLSQIVCTVRKNRVVVSCDGQQVIDWQGSPQELSLSEYWQTPHSQVLFLGAYDCGYRFHRVTLRPLSGLGKPLRESE